MKNMYLEKYEAERNVTSSVICNKCGGQIPFQNENPVEIELDFGYHSKHDMEHHSFDLCQSCYDEFIKCFIVPIKCTEINWF